MPHACSRVWRVARAHASRERRVGAGGRGVRTSARARRTTRVRVRSCGRGAAGAHEAEEQRAVEVAYELLVRRALEVRAADVAEAELSSQPRGGQPRQQLEARRQVDEEPGPRRARLRRAEEALRAPQASGALLGPEHAHRKRLRHRRHRRRGDMLQLRLQLWSGLLPVHRQPCHRHRWRRSRSRRERRLQFRRPLLQTPELQAELLDHRQRLLPLESEWLLVRQCPCGCVPLAQRPPHGIRLSHAAGRAQARPLAGVAVAPDQLLGA